MAAEIAHHDKPITTKTRRDFGRRLRRAASTQHRDRGTLPRTDSLDSPTRKVGAAPVEVRQGPSPRADAVAGQCVRRRRRGRVRSAACAAFWGLKGEHHPGHHGRAEDRRALRVAALREWRTRAGRDARRRRRRRGRHRQPADDRRDPEHAERQARRRARGARRGLYDHGDSRRSNERQAADGQADLRQPAQRAAGSLRQLDPSITAARPLRFSPMPGARCARCRPTTQIGMLQAFKSWGLPVNPLMRALRTADELLAYYHEIEATAREARLRHRRRRLQGRPAATAGAAGLRLALAALGHRAQVPGRAGDDGA